MNSYEERIERLAKRIEKAAEALWEAESPVLGLSQPWDSELEAVKDEYRVATRRTVAAFLEGDPVDQVDWKELTDGIESMLGSPTAEDILLLIERCTVRLEVSEDEYKGEVLRQLASTSEGSTVYGTDTRFQNIEWEER